MLAQRKFGTFHNLVGLLQVDRSAFGFGLRFFANVYTLTCTDVTQASVLLIDAKKVVKANGSWGNCRVPTWCKSQLRWQENISILENEHFLLRVTFEIYESTLGVSSDRISKQENHLHPVVLCDSVFSDSLVMKYVKKVW